MRSSPRPRRLLAEALTLAFLLQPWSSDADARPRATTTAELAAAAPSAGDVVLGSADAPVMVVEYTSLLCPYCGAFRREEWPAIRKEFVDAGKVRWIVREFTIGNSDFAAAMLARCEGAGAADLVDLMFARQREVVAANQSSAAFVVFAKARGFGAAELASCMHDKAIYDSVDSSKRVASERFGVEGTPTFFVDGRPLVGAAESKGLAGAIGRAVGVATR